MSENLRTAMITGAAVLFGGLIAGGSSIATTVVNQNGENERIERRLDQEARGAARVLFSRLTLVQEYIKGTLGVKGFPQSNLRFAAEPISEEDFKLIASRMPPTEFADVNDALGATESFFELRSFRVGKTLEAFDRGYIHLYLPEIRQGRRALLEIADIPGSALTLKEVKGS